MLQYPYEISYKTSKRQGTDLVLFVGKTQQCNNNDQNKKNELKSFQLSFFFQLIKCTWHMGL